MSEEKKELQTNEVTETMADYEDHFDDANPWNRVQDYMDKKTVTSFVCNSFISSLIKSTSFSFSR